MWNIQTKQKDYSFTLLAKLSFLSNLNNPNIVDTVKSESKCENQSLRYRQCHKQCYQHYQYQYGINMVWFKKKNLHHFISAPVLDRGILIAVSWSQLQWNAPIMAFCSDKNKTSQFSNYMQKAVTSVRLCWGSGLKKPRPVIHGNCL